MSLVSFVKAQNNCCSSINKLEMTNHGNGDKLESGEDILNKYRFLKIEQRFMMSKLTELQLDLHEHKYVFETPTYPHF